MVNEPTEPAADNAPAAVPRWRREQERLRKLWVLARPFMKAHKRELWVLVAMLLVLLGPFLLRPAQSTAPSRYDKRLVIMTPHHEMIRREFGRAFARHWKETTGQTLYIDWRVAGTAELGMLIKSDFTAAFQHHWKKTLKREWDTSIPGTFLNPKTPADNEARKEFLASTTSIGVDVFFGGGAYDFQSQAAAGTLVGSDPRTGAGLVKIRQMHPDWFGDTAIPARVSGEDYMDKEMRWCGTVLSCFGIVYNRDLLRRLGIEKEPTSWQDLADTRLVGQVALADPNKSASVTKAFEMLIQEQMHKAVSRLTLNPGRLRSSEEIEAAGVREGWLRGLALIQAIGANTRYFTDQSPKIPLEVAKGDAAAGMCIDFYGRGAEEDVRKADGSSRVGFVAPVGGTAVSVDPVAMLRGAPEPEVAQGFMEFVLSQKGQKLWNYRVGTAGGPETTALRRLPIRKDMYTADHLAMMSDPKEEPFEKAKAFIYRPEWTASTFNVIRFLVRVMCVDSHDELQQAWKDIAAQGSNPRALEALHQVEHVNYDTAVNELSRILAARDKVLEVREARRLSDNFRRQYQRAASYGIAGR